MDTFYKAGRALLARTDLTPAQKLVRIVRDHWLAFEGREATARELVKATGLSESGIRKVLTGRKTAQTPQSAVQSAVQSAPETAQSAVPSCSTSLSSVRDVDKGERQTAPSPSAAQGGKEKASGLKPQAPSLALLALKARAGGSKWSLTRWIGQVEEDAAAGRYARADLEAFVAARTAITEAPWKLAEAVRRYAEAAKQAAFRERLRQIRADGLTRAKGPDGPGAVVYVDPDMPLLVIEQPLPAVPGTSYGPGKKRWEVTTPADLAAWRFRADQPRLFDFGVGIPESGFKGKGERR